MPAHALPGQAVDVRSSICNFIMIILSSSHTIKCSCCLPLKPGDCQSSMLLIVPLCAAFTCTQVLFLLPYGKTFNHNGWLKVNELGRCDTMYCGKVFQKVKVTEMVPRFFGINKIVYFGKGFIFSQFLEVLTAKASGMEPAKLIK